MLWTLEWVTGYRRRTSNTLPLESRHGGWRTSRVSHVTCDALPRLVTEEYIPAPSPASKLLITLWCPGLLVHASTPSSCPRRRYSWSSTSIPNWGLGLVSSTRR